MSSAGIGRASVVIASGTFVSRILGFVSAALLTQVIGSVSVGSNLFAIANGLPNNISVIIATGLLSSVFVPAIVRAELQPDGGAAFINRLVTIGFTGFLAVGVVATLCAPLLVQLYAGGAHLAASDLSLATAFAYWCLPQVLFYAMYSLLGEVLNAKKVFGPFTWATLLNNIVAIAGLIVFAVVYGTKSAQGPSSDWTPGMVALLAGSATFGVFSQAAILTVFWRRAGLRFRPDFHWRGVGLGAAGKAASWTFFMVLVNQLAGVVQVNVLAITANSGEASSRVLNNAFLLFILPHSIAGWSIASAYFPTMTAHFRDGRMLELRHDVAAAMRSIGLVLVFSTVGFIVLAYPLSAPFSRTGYAGVSDMAPVLIALLVGLLPMSIHFLLRRVFYAVGDTRTPFFITVFQAVLFVIGALVVAVLPHEWIAVGIAIDTTVTGFLQCAVAFLLVRRRLGHIRGRFVLQGHVQFLVACIPAALLGLLVVWALGGYREGGFGVSTVFGGLVTAAAGGAVMAGAYVVVLLFMRNPELSAMIANLRRRLRRS